MDTLVPNITSHITHVRKAQGLFCYWPRNAKFQYFFQRHSIIAKLCWTCLVKQITRSACIFQTKQDIQTSKFLCKCQGSQWQSSTVLLKCYKRPQQNRWNPGVFHRGKHRACASPPSSAKRSSSSCFWHFFFFKKKTSKSEFFQISHCSKRQAKLFSAAGFLPQLCFATLSQSQWQMWLKPLDVVKSAFLERPMPVANTWHILDFTRPFLSKKCSNQSSDYLKHTDIRNIYIYINRFRYHIKYN